MGTPTATSRWRCTRRCSPACPAAPRCPPPPTYPFTTRVLDRLRERGVNIATLTLHTGVSSLEVEADIVEDHMLYAEPFSIPAETAEAVNAARRAGRRVIALGTTVVRALESAWDGQAVRATSGFTRLYIHPARGVNVIDGLITGLHDPVTSHLAMLYTIGGQDLIRDAYREAVAARYLWHEFGDTHLILADTRRAANQSNVEPTSAGADEAAGSAIAEPPSLRLAQMAISA
ncbi:MAG: S-adenosylmethionine:tRNA ribosyltransferase-isomerase [Chloroflexi bacterium]|nr:S-adenosylmethionine:tRNA ribosyltransferase-isomerase [Chloroflexota bacterium]